MHVGARANVGRDRGTAVARRTIISERGGGGGRRKRRRKKKTRKEEEEEKEEEEDGKEEDEEEEKEEERWETHIAYFWAAERTATHVQCRDAYATRAQYTEKITTFALLDPERGANIYSALNDTSPRRGCKHAA